MIYNNVTNTLRNWCHKMSADYADLFQQERDKKGQSFRFLSYCVTDELNYQLGTLIDQDFPSFEAYRGAVLALIPIHIDVLLTRVQTDAEAECIQTAETAFREYLESVLPDCPSPKVPYCRIIWGEEADWIASEIYRIWKYDANYWYPLKRMSGDDKLFISQERLDPYLKEIDRLLGLPHNHMYEYGEAYYDRSHCAEVDELQNYGGSESVYCPKDFSWLIYISHEDTVTFAGTIVPKIKEILRAEKEHWNRFE